MTFANRHIGPRNADVDKMLRSIDATDLNELIEQTIPESIRFDRELALPDAVSEVQALADLAELAGRNRVMRSLIGQGYYDTVTPSVILRNVIEDPGWYRPTRLTNRRLLKDGSRPFSTFRPWSLI